MLPLLGRRARWESAESAIPRSGSARRTASMAYRVRVVGVRPQVRVGVQGLLGRLVRGQVYGRSGDRQYLGAAVGHDEGLLELGDAGAVVGDDGPVVVPDVAVVVAEREHGLDGERHARLHDGRQPWLVVMQDRQARVERAVDPVAG